MIISETVIKVLNNTISGNPPETGGILGSREGETADTIFFDKTDNKYNYCCYSPNTSLLNSEINRWQSVGIRFLGIFHTHFAGVRTLSHGDKEYIKSIMNCMPDTVDYLFFPIYVLPERELVSYKAQTKNNDIIIDDDVIEIVT